MLSFRFTLLQLCEQFLAPGLSLCLLRSNVDICFLYDFFVLRYGDFELTHLHISLLQLKSLPPYLVQEFLILRSGPRNLFVKSVFLRQRVLAAQSHAVFQLRIQLEQSSFDFGKSLLFTGLLTVAAY